MGSHWHHRLINCHLPEMGLGGPSRQLCCPRCIGGGGSAARCWDRCCPSALGQPAPFASALLRELGHVPTHLRIGRQPAAGAHVSASNHSLTAQQAGSARHWLVRLLTAAARRQEPASLALGPPLPYPSLLHKHPTPQNPTWIFCLRSSSLARCSGGRRRRRSCRRAGRQRPRWAGGSEELSNGTPSHMQACPDRGAYLTCCARPAPLIDCCTAPTPKAAFIPRPTLSASSLACRRSSARRARSSACPPPPCFASAASRR